MSTGSAEQISGAHHVPGTAARTGASSYSAARAAGPSPCRSAEPVIVQRRTSNTGVIMVAGQKIAFGRIHAGQVVTVYVAEHSLTIDLADGDSRTIRRTTTQAVRSIKAHRLRPPPATATASGERLSGSTMPHSTHPQEAGSQ